MAGNEESSSRSLEQTPTWAFAGVCLVLVTILIVIEQIIHFTGKWLKKHKKSSLSQALEKIKSELMLLGFISLLLTVSQNSISRICVSQKVGDSWHPCKTEKEVAATSTTAHYVDSFSGAPRRSLLQTANSIDIFRRVLAGESSGDHCADKGKVPLISTDGIHELHIFIFVLAVSHVIYCISMITLSRLKMRRWKAWELETKTAEHQFSNDPSRFKFARDTTFGRRHLRFWSESPILIWIVCFFRQFATSVPKVDYLTLRHGFIMTHLAPHSSSKYDFQKYINRSLEEDIKELVGISPVIWFIVVLFLLSHTHGLHQLWLFFSSIPLIIVLLVGTKLQVIITRMAMQITSHGDIINGAPVVQPGDDLFWFKRPGLLLWLINFVLFQNAFEFAFFVWSWYEYGYPSCFYRNIQDIIVRLCMGIIIQVACSYITLPLYALVTQMGSNIKHTIFNERVNTALMRWHRSARKRLKENQMSISMTPMTPSTPATSHHELSPVHLLQFYRSDVDSLQVYRREYIVEDHIKDMEGSPSPSHHSTNDYPFQQPKLGPEEGLIEGKRPKQTNTGHIEISMENDIDSR